MSRFARPLLALLLGGSLSVLLVACDGGRGPASEAQVTPGTPTAEPAPDATPTPTPSPTPVSGAPERCRQEAALEARLETLEVEVTAAMQGYVGEWGLGLVDLDCDVEFAIRPDYVQYTASAGKIVPVIAALRAVEAGILPFEWIEPPLLLVMEHSLDEEATMINERVTPAQVQRVLELAGVSEQTRFEHDWRHAFMPALDLARVWAALLEGRLLGEEYTEYLLDLASRPAIPQGLETFPPSPELPGYQFGQKAGYYVSDGIPYYLLGAGYFRPEPAEGNGPPNHEGVAVVFMARTTNPELGDPQRRRVFPLIVDYVLGDDAAEAE